MGAIKSAIKGNKVGGVVWSVFDWYRMFAAVNGLCLLFQALITIASHYPVEERKLLRKLDLSILVFGCLSFFCRFLGQQNITNAYVSGMREDLGAFGNELNYYVVAYNTAYVLGQIPLMTLQTKAKMWAGI